MSVIVNELEVIAAPPEPEVAQNSEPTNVEAPGPTPHDVYWIMRQLLEREMRLKAR